MTPDPVTTALLRSEMPLSEDSRELLVQGLELFLRAGGRPTWALWATLSQETRIAWAQAGDRVTRRLGGLIEDPRLNEEPPPVAEAVVDAATEAAGGG